MYAHTDTGDRTHTHLIPIQLCLSESFNSDFLKSDNHETNKHVHKDEHHNEHVEHEV